jgi:hypothetical protein
MREIFPQITVSRSEARHVDGEIARNMADHGDSTFEATRHLADAWAELIAEDAINGEPQHPARIERYVYALRLIEELYPLDGAPDVSVALAAHTAAALDTITRSTT